MKGRFDGLMLQLYKWLIGKQFAMTGAVVLGSAYFGEGTGPILYFSCGGSEARLEECSFFPTRGPFCFHSEDVGVRCITNPGKDFDSSVRKTSLMRIITTKE